MKRTRAPLYRCAQRVRHQLALLVRGHAARRDQRLCDLNESCQVLVRRHGLMRLADSHGLALAAHKLRARLLEDVWRVNELAGELVSLRREPAPALPPLEPLLADLKQLQSEFAGAQFDLGEDRITVQTEPIVLEELALGPFEIALNLVRLGREPGSGCFRCIALEPNPPSGNPSVTHPHVSDEKLCAGDAFESIRLALAEGRICDAFLLVAGVLRTYNPSSPYVPLEEWEGATCPECSGTVRHQDDLYFCEGCNRDVCDGCLGRCDLCENSCCRACLESDQVSHRECCPTCRKTCGNCNRTVDTDSFDQPTELCPECLAEAEQEPSTPEPEETTHEPDDPFPALDNPVLAGSGEGVAA